MRLVSLELATVLPVQVEFDVEKVVAAWAEERKSVVPVWLDVIQRRLRKGAKVEDNRELPPIY
ncbi:hypothetical protein [Microcoleus sp. herbarium14]|uniref:hypothetical protein n=1 Tax=Microcoleus sp. herbarium14 TaxID=3055439 RepID=UPI002FD44E1F